MVKNLIYIICISSLFLACKKEKYSDPFPCNNRREIYKNAFSGKVYKIFQEARMKGNNRDRMTDYIQFVNHKGEVLELYHASTELINLVTLKDSIYKPKNSVTFHIYKEDGTLIGVKDEDWNCVFP